MPPADFIFSEQCLSETGGIAAIPANVPAKRKEYFETQCTVSWPCAGETGGLAPAYEELCPEDWQLQEDGTCIAPSSYSGPCYSRKSFLMFTPGMKETWSMSCNTSWPLRKTPPAGEAAVRPPQSAPLPGGEPGAGGAQVGCKHDYRHNCPAGYWIDAAGTCHASEGLPVLKACAQCDARRWSAPMKKAFEENCRIAWPCEGEAHMEGGSGVAGAGAALVGAQTNFKVGDHVLARDWPNQLWTRGEVKTLEPMRVQAEDEVAPREFASVMMPAPKAPDVAPSPLGPLAA